MAEWIVAEPGRLVLSGTRFSVRRAAGPLLPWQICEDNAHVAGRPTLEAAKSECEFRQRELVEVGLE